MGTDIHVYVEVWDDTLHQWSLVEITDQGFNHVDYLDDRRFTVIGGSRLLVVCQIS